MKGVTDGITHIKKFKKEIEEKKEKIDYVIVIPPVQERHLIDYMVADNYKLQRNLEEENIMLWLCNPEEKSVWSVQGAPSDKRFNEYFKFKFTGGLIGMLSTMPYRGETKEIQKELLEERNDDYRGR